jgi:hypothetical protein
VKQEPHLTWPGQAPGYFLPGCECRGEKALLNELSDDERHLLRCYAETERIIHGPVRGAVHQHLLRMGYIEE